MEFSSPKRESLDEMLPLVYAELRRLAVRYLDRERPNHTLQPTALVHEAYLRLAEQHSVDWKNRAQLIGLAAQMMRRILVNHAEAFRAAKRGDGISKITLDESTAILGAPDLDILNVNEALNRLAAIDEQKCRIVELRFFGGLTIEETAEVIGKSTATVEREWNFARSWLKRELS